MLIMTRFTHVLAGPTLRQRSFLNVIKFLGNELQIPIVVAGTHDAFNAIQTDPQLANRFEPAPLPRWTMNEGYLRLFASFEVGLELEQASHFIEPALATKIWRSRSPRSGRFRRCSAGRRWWRSGAASNASQATCLIRADTSRHRNIAASR